MPKQRPSKQPWDVRAADILAGRAGVDAGDLIDLIHEVNPTGRGRGAAETTARYALKSRLQSLLVTRFSADLEVAPDPDDPAVAALRHRYRRHDACHAVIASLDDDARSWVQLQLDIAASGGPASEEEAPSAPESAEPAPEDEDEMSAKELLAAGEEAQAAYDYERAGRCFSRAVSVSGGGAAAAAAFLAFTVDAMAADQDALSVEGRLPPATLADPRVALLLAVAAARVGDEARALRHVGRARDARAAEVLVLLARRALVEGDAERAARHVRAAEGEDPAHPELRTLADGIAAARAAERAPREAELAAFVAAGRDPEALAAAEAILARWPESETARRAARQIAERQKEGEGRRLVAEAEAALAQGNAAVAHELLQRALGCPLSKPDRERALGRVREAEAIERRQAARAQVDHVVALLSEADRARGLAAYVDLDDEVRGAVRARVSSPALAWLDAMPAARPGGRVRAVVEAVVALSRASALVEKDVAAAAALVAPHERLLDEVPLCRSIVERARAAAAAERARRAAAELHEAEEALAGGHIDRARGLLERLDLRALPEGDRARVPALEAGLAVAEERRREVRRFERLRGAGAFRAARATALAYAERGGAERDRWVAEAAAIDAEAGRYGLRVDDLSGGPELLQHAGITRLSRDASPWVAEGGGELVLANAEHTWLFLRFVDLATGRVVRGARLALDEPMNDVRLTVRPGGVTVIGNSGLFEIDVARGELVQRFHRNWNRDRGPCFSDGAPVAGTRLLWGSYGDDEAAVKIVDLDGDPAARNVGVLGGPWRVVGATPPRMVVQKRFYDESRDKEAYTLHVLEGSGAPLGRFDQRRSPEAAVVHPSGSGMVLLNDEFLGDSASLVGLVELSERFEVVAAPVLEEKGVHYPDPQAQMVVALDAGLVFVFFVRHGAASGTLVAMRSAGPGVPLVEHYRIPVPRRTTLAHDHDARRAFAVIDHPGGLAIVELGLEPPADLPDTGPNFILPEAFGHVNWCGLQARNDAVHVYVALRQLPAEQRPAAIAAREEAAAGDPQKLVELVHGLLHGDWLVPAERVLARAQAAYPDHPDVRVAPFAFLVARRQWAELLAVLDAQGTAPFEGPHLQHYHHLRAVACARLGLVDEALHHLALIEAAYGNCSHRAGYLRRALDTLPGGADDLAFDRPAAAQLVAVLHAADRHLAEGDPAAAIAVLERPLTWDLREVHSLGRLAEAHLAIEAASPAARFRKALALATFVECMEQDVGGRRAEGLAPGLAWTEERLEALHRAAVAWMTADLGAVGTASFRD